MTKTELEAEQKVLEEKLAELPKKRWNIVKNIVVVTLLMIAMPFLPMKGGGNLIEWIGFKSAIVSCFLFYIFIVVAAIYQNNRKVDYEISSLEVDIETIKRKRIQLDDERNGI
ncbi:hypothetical protein HKT18_13605 [Flavobacterium sp. IMCC34852]|uniref:DUF485 domain-containing protein n=1 Tax=Flavobacterium rivulicola TaxID=2732161 RepID=A0A7Y3RBT8_9FLAO|nr:hypothetical protein [Flavobacterium sp. IMCC34852]NNT73255.1 hypothetical protein [Flavobacterium sp. IMCC34852]